MKKGLLLFLPPIIAPLFRQLYIKFSLRAVGRSEIPGRIIMKIPPSSKKSTLPKKWIIFDRHHAINGNKAMS